jgi:hypothetical protein
MSTATFTVPLTARVLRAILADMEGTEGLLGGCGCKAPSAPEPMWTNMKAWSQLAGKVDDNQGIITELSGHTLNEMDYAAIDYLCNEFDYGFHPITAPLTSGIVEPGNPFILTPEGPVAVNPTDVTDPFVLQVATPPAPPMPPATVTPVPPIHASAVPLDGEGLPWDKRIHASTKTFRQSDNTWKLTKGVDKDLVERVKAELRATMSAGTPPVAPAPPATVAHLSGSYVAPNYSGAQSGGYQPAAPVPSTPPTIAAVETVPTTTVPQPPNVPVVVPPPVPAATEQPAVFSEFVTWVTGKLVAKEFSRDQLQAACAAEGITSMPMLENRPDLVPSIWKFLESICIPMTSVGGA